MIDEKMIAEFANAGANLFYCLDSDKVTQDKLIERGCDFVLLDQQKWYKEEKLPLWGVSIKKNSNTSSIGILLPHIKKNNVGNEFIFLEKKLKFSFLKKTKLNFISPYNLPSIRDDNSDSFYVEKSSLGLPILGQYQDNIIIEYQLYNDKIILESEDSKIKVISFGVEEGNKQIFLFKDKSMGYTPLFTLCANNKLNSIQYNQQELLCSNKNMQRRTLLCSYNDYRGLSLYDVTVGDNYFNNGNFAEYKRLWEALVKEDELIVDYFDLCIHDPCYGEENFMTNYPIVFKIINKSDEKNIIYREQVNKLLPFQYIEPKLNELFDFAYDWGDIRIKIIF